MNENMGHITIRPYKAGEASYVSYLQMKFYERAYGFKGIFEHYLLASMAEFTAFPDGGRLWVALDGDNIIGSIAIVNAGDTATQLRWFIVGERYQGKGVGGKLMDTAMCFCKEQGYHHIILWTIEMLDAARRLYERYGFKLVDKKLNTEWTNRPLTEERWDLFL